MKEEVRLLNSPGSSVYIYIHQKGKCAKLEMICNTVSQEELKEDVFFRQRFYDQLYILWLGI